MQKLALALLALATLSMTACKKKETGSGEAMTKMAGFKDEMCKCKDAKCAQDVSDKMSKWSQDQAKNQTEPPKMNEADQKQVATLGEEMGKCMQTALAAAGSAGPAPAAGSTAAPATAPADMPGECSEYKAAIDKLSTCDKMTPAAREPLEKAYAQAAAGWAKLPPDAKASLAPACKTGTEAVMAAAKQSCGW